MTLEETARYIADQIDQFDAKCAEAEYTDTGEVWELLGDWRNLLHAVLPKKVTPL